MGQRQKILVVDDSKIDLRLNQELLRGVNADIVTAASGKEAVQKSITEDFDLILMDVMMPGMDGFEAVEAIKKDEKNKFTPVIFITGLPGEEKRIIEAFSLGVVDFITKPAHKEVLRLKVNNLLELQRHRKELEHTRNELVRKVEELEKFTKLACDMEKSVIELKNEVNEIKLLLGEKVKGKC